MRAYARERLDAVAAILDTVADRTELDHDRITDVYGDFVYLESPLLNDMTVELLKAEPS